MARIELKKCPFCGDIQHVTHVELSNGLHYIECKRCGAAPHRLGAWDYETAVKYWNSAWMPRPEPTEKEDADDA
jgi:transcription elongation factor Elf1